MIEKNKKIKKRNKSMTLIFLLLLGISIGFAYLTSNLSIFGSSLLKGQKWDVHFENVQVSSEGVQIEKPEIIDKTKVEYNIILDKPGDFVEFTVDAKNDGTINAMISSKPEIKMYDEKSDELLESIPDYLDYKIFYEDYDDINIKENHLLEVGQTITYKVYLSYKKDITNEQLVTSKKELKAEFNVEYVQADKNAIPYNQHEVTESTLSKSNFRSFGKSNKPKEVVFVDTGVINEKDKNYRDISEEQDKSILAWMDGETMYVSAKDSGLYVKAPEDCSELLGYWSSSLDCWVNNLIRIDISKLDTSKVTNMSNMFAAAGKKQTGIFKIDGLSKWDTSNVTNMGSMFYSAGYDATTWSIGDLSGWDTSRVTNMNYMFNEAGKKAIIFDIGDISGWDTSSVKSMKNMFKQAGDNATTWSIGDLSGWDTSKVADMSYMFNHAGTNATTFKLDLSGWDTSNVENMKYMFQCAGVKVATWSIGDISKWKTGKVTDMSYMFDSAGYNATTFKLDLSGWDTSKVADMSYMFNHAGYKATTFKLDLNGWDTSKVTDMSYMFYELGKNATEWSIGDISGWNTGNVTNMSNMFYNAGYKANYSLDLSSWNVDNVTKYTSFNSNVTSKIKAPIWVN